MKTNKNSFLNTKLRNGTSKAPSPTKETMIDKTATKKSKRINFHTLLNINIILSEIILL